MMPASLSQSRPASSPAMTETGRASRAIAWSSLVFAFLQSVCTFFAAMNGLRLVIGLGTFVLSATVAKAVDQFHADWIRIPMVLLALLGALLNLAILFQVRRLRRRPSSQWRQQPVSGRKLRMERLQIVLAVVTLVLIAVEEFFHFRTCGHL